MQKDTIIYVTDQRQKYLADMLGGEQTDCRNSGGIDYERVGNIVFPTPFSKLKLINSDIEKLKHNIIINNIAVWGGMMPECFPGVDKGCDFMRDETVIEQNAIVTAEATVSIAIQKSIHRKTQTVQTEPPAESPSTIYNSHSLGSRLEQSESLPGILAVSSADFLLTSSLALFAASLARCALCAFS